ncbi:protein ANTAGONIST OF LIKE HETEROCHROMATIN PROTEIN 1-like [Photinus pyralis]|uniref:protein ANTAGONIST OF LIKE HETEROCHROMATIN PROTEIN 1-like n=1 Tax=Photinus pyralis TaxID=7054 RepID=UPI0012671249|nr:protein ANTAGONIST OF LIKE HETEROCHROMATIN PROTEIN 1-like [Photinus pyralis]
MNSDDEEVCALAAYYILLSGQCLLKKKKKRRWWMGALNKSRERYNASNMLCDLRSQPSGRFENFCRMTATDFENLLSRIGPFIAKQDTNMRKCVPSQERLAIALRFFATGDSFASLSYLFKVSKQTISRCVDDVCLAIIQELKDEVELPSNEEEWLKIAQDYEKIWNFPNCLGAIDGKHIVIECPKNTESEFYNYKGTFSVVLLAVVDANYPFIFVDIGCQRPDQ